MALMNRHLTALETVFLPADRSVVHIASSIVKDVARPRGPIDDLVPDGRRRGRPGTPVREGTQDDREQNPTTTAARASTGILEASRGSSPGRAMPMSSSVLVNKAELLDLIDQAHAILPTQLTEADQVLAGADEVLAEARAAGSAHLSRRAHGPRSSSAPSRWWSPRARRARDRRRGRADGRGAAPRRRRLLRPPARRLRDRPRPRPRAGPGRTRQARRPPRRPGRLTRGEAGPAGGARRAPVRPFGWHLPMP